MSKKGEVYPCPVCGYALTEPPENHNICPLCATHFGYEDVGFTHEELRERWAGKVQIELGSRTWFAHLRAALADRDKWYNEACARREAWNGAAIESARADAAEERCRQLEDALRELEELCVDLVAKGVLTTRVVWLCPNGQGETMEADHLRNLPSEVTCSRCGQEHWFTDTDIQIRFVSTSSPLPATPQEERSSPSKEPEE